MKSLLWAALLERASLCIEQFRTGHDGNIVGTMPDASGVAVPSANVELQNMKTGVKNSTKTEGSGFYLNNVLVGL